MIEHRGVSLSRDTIGLLYFLCHHAVTNLLLMDEKAGYRTLCCIFTCLWLEKKTAAHMHYLAVLPSHPSKIGASLSKPHTSEIAVLIVTSLVCCVLYAMGVDDSNGRTMQ